MTQIDVYSREHVKKENLLNEYKGLLFEYLLAEEIAKSYGILPQFIQNIPAELHRFLKEYQKKIHLMDSKLIRKLPLFAKESFSHLKNRLPEDVSFVFLVGKLFGASHNDAYSESDIYLMMKDGKDFKLSLKLCKWNAFVNTKNGGVQSFIEKYFAFPDAFEKQEELNDVLNEEFNTLIKKLLLVSDLIPDEEPTYSFFQKNWEKHYSHLPGELPTQMREILFEYYFKVITKIYEVFENYFKEDSLVFLKSLYPLLGFGGPDICQLNVFHQDHEEIKGIHILTFEDLTEELKYLRIEKPKKGTSSFHLYLKNLVLQIRVKPMNSFMVKGLKVNCSVKHI